MFKELDKTMPMRRSGFDGERLEVLPRTRVAEALGHPVLGRLLVTDVGHFPVARDHGRSRAHGSAQHIVIICSAGRGRAEVGGMGAGIGPGEALVIPAGVPHTYLADESDPWTIWWLHVAGRDAAALLGCSGARLDSPVIRVPRLDLAVDLVRAAIDAVATDVTDAGLLASSGAAWHLLATLGARSSAEATAVELARTFIVEHAAEPLSVAEIAGHVHLSLSHFAALFQRDTGQTPMAYVGMIRMRLARQLLDTTRLPVSVVAQQAGFADPAYFSRRFRQVHSLSPREYRASQKG